jgi:hypothetical protein
MMVDNVLCHLGRLGPAGRNLTSKVADLKRSPHSVLKLNPKLVFGNGDHLFDDSSVSETQLCALMSSILNDRTLVALPIGIAAYMLPGSRDLVLLDGKKLAPKLKQTLDDQSRYRPSLIEELRLLGLGDIALREVTKLALSIGIGLSISDNAILTSQRCRN